MEKFIDNLAQGVAGDHIHILHIDGTHSLAKDGLAIFIIQILLKV